MSGLYTNSFSPARALSPQIRSIADVDSQYLAELLAEHQKLVPFMQVLPICSRLLNQEITRVSGMVSNQGFGDFDRLQSGSPSPMRIGFPQGINMDWQGAPPSPCSYIVKKILRLETPVDTYPNFNFVGRLLGPRGNSLKRMEASTGCRVYIRGKGSIKDPGKVMKVLPGVLQEEKLRGRQGYEHLNDPLHILIEAELPVNVVDVRLRQAQEIIEELLKPFVIHMGHTDHIPTEIRLDQYMVEVKLIKCRKCSSDDELDHDCGGVGGSLTDESQDYYKRQQLRELAMLNSGLREDGPHPSGSVSPFGNSGMKRAKTGW